MDEFGKLHGVAGLAAEGHDGGGRELARLVIGGLEDRGAAHGGFGGGDYGEIQAGEAKENFPVWIVRDYIGGFSNRVVIRSAYMVDGALSSRLGDRGATEVES